MPQHPIITGALRRRRKEGDSMSEKRHQQRGQQELQQQQQHGQQEHEQQHPLHQLYNQQQQQQRLMHARLSCPLSSCTGGRTARSSWECATAQPSRHSSCSSSRKTSDLVYSCPSHARFTHVSSAASAACETASAVPASAAAAAPADAAAADGCRKAGNVPAVSGGSRCFGQGTNAEESLNYTRVDPAAAGASYLGASFGAGTATALAGPAARTATPATKGLPQSATDAQALMPLASSVRNAVTAANRSRLTEARQTSYPSSMEKRAVDTFLDAYHLHCDSLRAPAAATTAPDAALPTATGAGSAAAADASFTTASASAAASASSCISGAAAAISAGVYSLPDDAYPAATAAAAIPATASPLLSSWQIATADRVGVCVPNSAEISSGARLSTDAFRLNRGGAGPAYRLSSSVVPTSSTRFAPSSFSSFFGDGGAVRLCPSPFRFSSSVDACVAADQLPSSSSLTENVAAARACGASSAQTPHRVPSSDCAPGVKCTYTRPRHTNASADSDRAASAHTSLSRSPSLCGESIAAPLRTSSIAASSHTLYAGTSSFLPSGRFSSTTTTPTGRQQPRGDAASSAAVHPPVSVSLRHARTLDPAFTSSSSVANAPSAGGHTAAAALRPNRPAAAGTPLSPPARAPPPTFAWSTAAAPCRQAIAAARAQATAAAVCHQQPSAAESVYSQQGTETLSVPAANVMHAAVQQQKTRALLSPSLSAQVAPRRSDPLYDKKRGFQGLHQQRHSGALFCPGNMAEEHSFSSACKTLSRSSSNSSSGHWSYGMLSPGRRSTATKTQQQLSFCRQHIAESIQWRGNVDGAAATFDVNDSPEDVSFAKLLQRTAGSSGCLKGTPATWKTSRAETMQTGGGVFSHKNGHAAETFCREKHIENTGATRIPHAANERFAGGWFQRVRETHAGGTTLEKPYTPRASLSVEESHGARTCCSPSLTDLHRREATAPGTHSLPAAGGFVCSADEHAAASSSLLEPMQTEAAPRFCTQSSYGEAVNAAPGQRPCRQEAPIADLDGVVVAPAAEDFYAEKAEATPRAEAEQAVAAFRSYRVVKKANQSLPNKISYVAPSCNGVEMPAKEVSVFEQTHNRGNCFDLAAAAQNIRQVRNPVPSSCSHLEAGRGSSASGRGSSEVFDDATQSMVAPGYMQQRHQHCPIPPVVAVSRAIKASTCKVLQQDCGAATPTGRWPDPQRGHLDFSQAAAASLACCNIPSTSRTAATLAAAAALPGPRAVAAASPAASGAASAFSVAPAASLSLPAASAAFAHPPSAAAGAPCPTDVSAGAAQAAPGVGAPSLQKAQVKCCLPPALRNRFRVLQQVGKGMYGDVFVCVLRQPPASTSAAASPKKQVQQQDNHQPDTALQQQQGERQHAPQPKRQQQHYKQQREYLSIQPSNRRPQQSQQQQHRLCSQRPQEDRRFVASDDKDQEREVDDVEMCSAQRSTSPGCALPISKPASEFFHGEEDHGRSASAASAVADGVGAGAAAGTEASAAVTGANGGAAGGAGTSLATVSSVVGCMHLNSSKSSEVAPAAGEAVALSPEGVERSEEQEQQPRFHEEEQQHQHQGRHGAQRTQEKENGEGRCAGREQQRFAMKRVRLPTSKLKAIFGIEQQVLREITLLRTLKHVNILRLHAFHFELERWERRSSGASRGHQPPTLLQQQQQQQPKERKNAGAPRIPQNPMAGLASEQPAPSRLAAGADTGAAAPEQEAAVPQEGIRAEQMYRPTFYLFFELCDCDLAQIIDETYEKFLQFWKKEVKEAAAAKAVEPRAIIQELLQTSMKTIPRPGFDEEETQLIAYQLFQAIAYCHSRDVMHRDIKPQNIMMLLDREASVKFPWVVKLGDFGLACHAYARDACRTMEVVTLLYRPPELLMGCSDYTTAVDVWSAGIVVAEMILGRPPFRGQSGEADLLSRMQQWLGSPTSAELQRFCAQPAPLAEVLKKGEPLMPGPATRENRLRLLLTDQFDRQLLSNLGIHFLATVLQTDPKLRPSAVEALQHPWLRSVLEKFGNRDVYLQPSDITLPPDFLAVDPINYSFYFSPIQMRCCSESDDTQQGQENRKTKKRPLVMPWEHPPQGHYHRFDHIRRPHLIPRLDVDTVISIYRKAGIFSDGSEDG